MEKSFDDLSTEQFRKRMRPFAVSIYQSIFPGSRLEDLRENGIGVHILDKEFAIDTLWHLASGQWLSIQEKYRNHDYLVEKRLQIKPPHPDFTQEYMNGAGTQHEAKGEWFHLAAHLYFYGWANVEQTGFEKWILMDVAKYKALVESRGGLDKIGNLYNNRKHGAASFYAISLLDLEHTVVLDNVAWNEKNKRKSHVH